MEIDEAFVMYNPKIVENAEIYKENVIHSASTAKYGRTAFGREFIQKDQAPTEHISINVYIMGCIFYQLFYNALLLLL